MKLGKMLGITLAAAMILSGCAKTDDPLLSENTMENQMGEETISIVQTETSTMDSTQLSLLSRCEEITSLYADFYEQAPRTEPQNPWETPTLSQDSIDTIENILLDAGLDVMDTNGEYPSYLKTAENFYAFWEKLQRRQQAAQGAKNGTIFQNRTKQLLQRRVACVFFCFYDRYMIIKAFSKHPLEIEFVFKIVLTIRSTLVIIDNTKISALAVNQIEFRKDCDLCTMSNIIKAYSISTAV